MPALSPCQPASEVERVYPTFWPGGGGSPITVSVRRSKRESLPLDSEGTTFIPSRQFDGVEGKADLLSQRRKR